MEGFAKVLVDGPSRMGLLSYSVPGRLSVAPGDAVLIPFGRSEREGMIVEMVEDDPLASREVISRIGSRALAADVALALSVAEERFIPAVDLLRGLAPRTHRDAPPSRFLSAALAASSVGFSVSPARNWLRRAVLCPPALPLADAAAAEAVRMSEEYSGQVLVLCPTVEHASEVRRSLSSGSALLSSSSSPGVWTAWRRGILPVAVGVRSSVWYSPRSLAGIVVVDDGHPGHTALRFPRLDAAWLACRRAETHGCALSLVSRVVSARHLGERVKVVEAEVRGASWPSVRIVDRSRFPASEPLPALLAGELSRAGSRGLAAVVIAEKAPSVRRCSRCSAVCPCACGASGCSHRLDPPCTACDSRSARWSGWDVQRCLSGFPGTSVVTLAQAAKLPRAPRLVIVPEVARLAHVPSARPTELAASVLLSAAAAAGAGGRLVVGAWDGRWLALQTLAGKDLVGFSRQAYGDAKAAGAAPFGFDVLLRFERKRPPRISDLPGGVFVSRPVFRAGVWEVRVRGGASEWPAVRAALGGLVSRRGVEARFI